jgi:hypothetical protein
VQIRQHQRIDAELCDLGADAVELFCFSSPENCVP